VNSAIEDKRNGRETTVRMRTNAFVAHIGIGMNVDNRMMQKNERIGIFDKMGWEGLSNMDFPHRELLSIEQRFYFSEVRI
jgi:hypothetical protein